MRCCHSHPDATLREDQSAWPQRAKELITQTSTSPSHLAKDPCGLDPSQWRLCLILWFDVGERNSHLVFSLYSDPIRANAHSGNFTPDSRLQHATTMVSGVTTVLPWNMLHRVLRTSWAGTLIHNVTDLPSSALPAKARRKLLLRCIDQ